MSEKLGISQSHYSKIESGEYDPSKHMRQLSKIFGCEPNELFSGQILIDIESDFINDPRKEMQCLYHNRNPKKVYLKMEGWFTADEVSRFLIYAIDGIGSDNEN